MSIHGSDISRGFRVVKPAPVSESVGQSSAVRYRSLVWKIIRNSYRIPALLKNQQITSTSDLKNGQGAYTDYLFSGNSLEKIGGKNLV